jgi:hypothetical protein
MKRRAGPWLLLEAVVHSRKNCRHHTQVPDYSPCLREKSALLRSLSGKLETAADSSRLRTALAGYCRRRSIIRRFAGICRRIDQQAGLGNKRRLATDGTMGGKIFFE